MVTTAPIASRLLFCAVQANGDGVADDFHFVAKYAQLRAGAVLQHHFEAAIAVKIRKRKSAAVVEKVEPETSRKLPRTLPLPLLRKNTLRS